MDLHRTYSLILLGRYPGKDEAVAMALSKAFGRDPNWGLEVVELSPVTLLSNLNATQAEFILKSLKDVEVAGSKFELREGLDPECPPLEWFDPPVLMGRSV
jgi:hypothetical protein